MDLQKKFDLVTRYTNEVIWKLDKDLNSVFITPSVERLRGFTPEEVLLQPFDQVFTSDSASILEQRLELIKRNDWEVLEHARRDHFELEQICKDGTSIWTEVILKILRTENGDFEGLILISLNISRRKQLEAALRQLATTDPLTGLLNRRQFFELAEREIERAKRYKRELSILILDIDNFNSVNEVYGFTTGDNVLKRIAKCCQTTLRDTDLLGKYGGEEFIILLPETNLENTCLLVQRLQEMITNESYTDLGVESPITTCAGITMMKDEATIIIDQFINQAVKALSQAQKSGPGQIKVFN
ncbi:MAG: GGDEF domain-containing protein [Anaerolineaceae bacterium]|nr:GGDEF domain-containing protein [Anaerolineaceae bacterium]